MMSYLQGCLVVLLVFQTVVDSAPQKAVYRYWKLEGADHFYTDNANEIGTTNAGEVGNYGYKSEGIAFNLPTNSPGGSVDLYRYWNPINTDHFYTTNWAELGNGAGGWGYEGVLGQCFSTEKANTIPLYRYWNLGGGDHFYTTNRNEIGDGSAWEPEGITCYVYPGNAAQSVNTTTWLTGTTNTVWYLMVVMCVLLSVNLVIFAYGYCSKRASSVQQYSHAEKNDLL